MTHTNSISFDLTWYSILSQYSASVRRTVCDAVLNFALTGEIPVLKGIAKIAFQFISHEISKQLGREKVESIQVPVPAAPAVDAPDEDAKDVAEIQQDEAVSTAEGDETPAAVQAQAEEDVLPESDPERTETEMPDAADDAAKDTAPSVALPVGKCYSVPASPARKARGSVSRNRISSGKITCTRKGSKILFRRH